MQSGTQIKFYGASGVGEALMAVVKGEEFVVMQQTAMYDDKANVDTQVGWIWYEAEQDQRLLERKRRTWNRGVSVPHKGTSK